jgi:hypothetical protein
MLSKQAPRVIFAKLYKMMWPALCFSFILTGPSASSGSTGVRNVFAEKPSDCFPWIFLFDEGFPDEYLQ